MVDHAEGSGTVALRVNGDEVTLEERGDPSLLLALRGQLGLHGVRPGCAIGECGACTVLIDGVAQRACQRTVGDVAGTSILTPEGLDGHAGLADVRSAFLERQAAQCGYCVNGIVMRLCGMVQQGDAPASAEDLAGELNDQLCRCGTHARLMDAACAALEIEPADGSMQLRPADTGVAEDVPDIALDPPDVEAWLALDDEGHVRVNSGRSEIGQAVHEGLRRIVASQLGVDPDVVVVDGSSTTRSPDEGVTAGSRSMRDGGATLATMSRAMRRLLLERAAGILDVGIDAVEIDPDGGVRAGDHRVGFDELSRGGEIKGVATLEDRPDWRVLAAMEASTRTDLAGKLRGAAFVHDLVLDDMLYARVVLPPTYDARLVDADTERVAGLDGVVEVVRDGSLLIVVAVDEAQAVRAAAVLAASASWDDPGLDVRGPLIEQLRSLPSEPYVERDDGLADHPAGAATHRASYAKPYQAHGAMAPSCAVALHDGRTLQVWTHAQGVFPLRRELAVLFDMPEEHIAVNHAHGPGAYGQNAADDAAAFAAVAALAVAPRPVSLQLASTDEFAWEPYGPAMTVDIEATTDDGTIVTWRHRVRSDSHNMRPRGTGDKLAASWLREDAVARPWGGPMLGASRDAVPIYDLPAVEAVADHVRGPLRTGSLRSLGSFTNMFAIESFMDELAEHAGEDPVAFRRRHLADQRAIEVLDALAEEVAWTPHVGPSGAGRGLSLGRYHGMGYVAMLVDVDVDVDADRLALTRFVAAVDVGTVVDRSGLRQQLEGGIVQGISRTLYEQVTFASGGITSLDWSTYPVARFTDVPPMEFVVLDRAGIRPLGAGEITSPLVPAAIANAIDDALGVRLRELPISVDAIRGRVLAMDDDELARVRDPA